MYISSEAVGLLLRDSGLEVAAVRMSQFHAADWDQRGHKDATAALNRRLNYIHAGN